MPLAKRADCGKERGNRLARTRRSLDKYATTALYCRKALSDHYFLSLAKLAVGKSCVRKILAHLGLPCDRLDAIPYSLKHLKVKRS